MEKRGLHAPDEPLVERTSRGTPFFVKVVSGQRSASAWNGCRSFHQVTHAHQVVYGGGEGKQPAHSPHATEFDLAQQSHGLQPADDLFDSLALLLTDGTARVPGGSAINRTSTVCTVQIFGAPSGCCLQ